MAYCGCPDGAREVWAAAFIHAEDKAVKLVQKGKGSQQANREFLCHSSSVASAVIDADQNVHHYCSS